MRLRDRLKVRRMEAVIPSTATRFKPLPLNQRTYKRRNRIERLFCHIKNWRRIAMQYDQLAQSYMTSLALVPSITAWA